MSDKLTAQPEEAIMAPIADCDSNGNCSTSPVDNLPTAEKPQELLDQSVTTPSKDALIVPSTDVNSITMERTSASPDGLHLSAQKSEGSVDMSSLNDSGFVSGIDTSVLTPDSTQLESMKGDQSEASESAENCSTKDDSPISALQILPPPMEDPIAEDLEQDAGNNNATVGTLFDPSSFLQIDQRTPTREDVEEGHSTDAQDDSEDDDDDKMVDSTQKEDSVDLANNNPSIQPTGTPISSDSEDSDAKIENLIEDVMELAKCIPQKYVFGSIRVLQLHQAKNGLPVSFMDGPRWFNLRTFPVVVLSQMSAFLWYANNNRDRADIWMTKLETATESLGIPKIEKPELDTFVMVRRKMQEAGNVENQSDMDANFDVMAESKRKSDIAEMIKTAPPELLVPALRMFQFDQRRNGRPISSLCELSSTINLDHFSEIVVHNVSAFLRSDAEMQKKMKESIEDKAIRFGLEPPGDSELTAPVITYTTSDQPTSNMETVGPRKLPKPYVSVYGTKVVTRRHKVAIFDKLNTLERKFILPIYRIIQLAQLRMDGKASPFLELCSSYINLNYFPDDVIIQLYDYLKMVGSHLLLADRMSRSLEKMAKICGLDLFVIRVAMPLRVPKICIRSNEPDSFTRGIKVAGMGKAALKHLLLNESRRPKIRNEMPCTSASLELGLKREHPSSGNDSDEWEEKRCREEPQDEAQMGSCRDFGILDCNCC